MQGPIFQWWVQNFPQGPTADGGGQSQKSIRGVPLKYKKMTVNLL